MRWFALGWGLLAAALVRRRLAAALVTLRAQAWTPILLRRLSRWVRARHYTDDQFFRADGAREPWVARRRAGIERLSALLRMQYSASLAWGEVLRESFSDLRFTAANRVPFPFARFMHEHFNLSTVVTASDGPWLP